MSELVTFGFYNISRCGYYESTNDDVAKFGTIKEILEQLEKWVSAPGKTLKDTCTYEINEHESLLQTYCYGIKKNKATGDYLITTWNRLPDNSGRIASVSGSQPVGAANVSFMNIPKDGIPGYATYFWFIPSKNMLATIKFPKRILNGHRNLSIYLSEFIGKCSAHVVLDENDGESNHVIAGYQKNDGDPVLPLHPVYRSISIKMPAQIEYIRENHKNITGLIRKNLLNPQPSNQEDTLLGKFLGAFGLSAQRPGKPEIKVKYEMAIKPSLDEVNAIISMWIQEHSTKWDDIGFKFKDQSIRWLSHSLAKAELEMDVESVNSEIYDQGRLLDEIVKHRDYLLGHQNS